MPGTIHAQLERAADRFGDRDAIWAGDERWSFRQLDERCNAFARHLMAEGVTAGARVVHRVERGRLKQRAKAGFGDCCGVWAGQSAG